MGGWLYDLYNCKGFAVKRCENVLYIIYGTGGLVNSSERIGISDVSIGIYYVN